jgi:Cu-Zn family superoxide dismutase
MKKFKSLLPLAAVMLGCSLIFSCNNTDKKTGTSTYSDTSKMDNTTNKMEPVMDTMTVPTVTHAEATISGTYPDTTVNGLATFETMTDGQVKMTLNITVAAKANKTVAVHIHEHGDCADNGNASHGHWNPGNTQHGKWGSNSFHAGDIGNVKLNAKGKGTLTVTTDLWTLGGMANKNILGKAMIVHGGEDDYTTQPSGNAGSRIGRGLIGPK